MTITNYGSVSETFNITLYANTIVIGWGEITLQSETSITLTFKWNNTSFAKGNYTFGLTYGRLLEKLISMTTHLLIVGFLFQSPGDVMPTFRLIGIYDVAAICAAYELKRC